MLSLCIFKQSVLMHVLMVYMIIDIKYFWEVDILWSIYTLCTSKIIKCVTLQD